MGYNNKKVHTNNHRTVMAASATASAKEGWTTGPTVTDEQLLAAMKRANLSAAEIALIFAFREAPENNRAKIIEYMATCKPSSTAPGAPANEGQEYLNKVIEKIEGVDPAEFALVIFYRVMRSEEKQKVAFMLDSCPIKLATHTTAVTRMLDDVIQTMEMKKTAAMKTEAARQRSRAAAAAAAAADVTTTPTSLQPLPVFTPAATAVAVKTAAASDDNDDDDLPPLLPADGQSSSQTRRNDRDQ
jgi:hypothetical protein